MLNQVKRQPPSSNACNCIIKAGCNIEGSKNQDANCPTSNLQIALGSKLGEGFPRCQLVFSKFGFLEGYI
ncbi:hypothetical protein GOP47_0025403 [Adiantum capillus-veneris]|uniref:Uncharacterized protein n=1 Tax=Adiantum capillus-veneris TaxID=13818 RepID=A0A9D4U231_ADICA|nr:hypothetical protein GOP47_0025403 [Adiantum capillus-veneris]